MMYWYDFLKSPVYVLCFVIDKRWLKRNRLLLGIRHKWTCPVYNPSQAGWYLIYLHGRDERLSSLWCWLYTQTVYFSNSQWPIYVLTGPGVWQLSSSSSSAWPELERSGFHEVLPVFVETAMLQLGNCADPKLTACWNSSQCLIDTTGTGLDGEGASYKRGGSLTQADYTEVTVHSPSASMYVLTDLDKFTRYELRIQPFYASVTGASSNLIRFQTAPDSKRFSQYFRF